MKTSVSKLKCGDKVNMHEWGWYTVRSITKYKYEHLIEVFYDTASGVTSILYNADFDVVEVI